VGSESGKGGKMRGRKRGKGGREGGRVVMSLPSSSAVSKSSQETTEGPVLEGEGRKGKEEVRDGSADRTISLLSGRRGREEGGKEEGRTYRRRARSRACEAALLTTPSTSAPE